MNHRQSIVKYPPVPRWGHIGGGLGAGGGGGIIKECHCTTHMIHNSTAVG